MKHVADYYRVYFILIVILGEMHPSAFAQDSLPYPVILSSRWFHPTSPQDTLSTMRMVDLYHPDRIDWMYCTNADQLAQLKRRNIPYSLAINPQVPDSLGYTAKGRVVDLDGKKLVAPWMRSWKQKNANWGCVNAPEFKKVFYAQSYKLVDLGAYGLFVDDARFNDHSIEWGGCFCDYCMAGFTKYLHAEIIDSLGADFNYRSYLHRRGLSVLPVKGKGQQIPLWSQFQRFQTQSVIQFLKSWRNDVKTYAKRPVTFLTNNFGGRWTEIYQVFDVGIAELPEEKIKPDFIQKQVETAKALGKQQYFTVPSDDSQKQLKTLLLTYAAGSGLVIPWDVMVTKKSTLKPERYFGPAAVYEPVYNLFQVRSSVVSRQHTNVRARIANTLAFKIESAGKRDALNVEQFLGIDRQIVRVTNKDNDQVHKITVTPIGSTSVSSVKVIFPTNSNYSIQDKKLEIEYEGDLAVLDIQP